MMTSIMETFSALMTLCEVKQPFNGQVIGSINVLFVVVRNKLMHKLLNCPWFETPWRSCDIAIIWNTLFLKPSMIFNLFDRPPPPSHFHLHHICHIMRFENDNTLYDLPLILLPTLVTVHTFCDLFTPGLHKQWYFKKLSYKHFC